jgi:hypothetical protein
VLRLGFTARQCLNVYYAAPDWHLTLELDL